MKENVGAELQVRRLSHAFGVEIQGVDLRENQADATIAAIRRLWNDNGIVLLRGQQITPARLIDYSRRFGELDLHETLQPFRHPDHPELFVLSTIPLNGKPSVSENVGRHWHSDLSYPLRPPLVAQLRVANPPIAQPLVRPHSETGRKSLYLSEQMTKRIVGMTERESAPLLRFLFEHSVDPLFTYRRKWAKNDNIMWDNRSTMHLALADFGPGAHRYCMRTALLGTPSGYIFQG